MFRRLRPDLSSLRWKIAALAAVTACLVVTAVGVLVHWWTADAIRSRAEGQAFDSLISAMDVYRRTGTLVKGAELDPAELPATLRHPDDGDQHTAYDIPVLWAAQRTGGPGSPVLAVNYQMGTELHNLRELDATMVVSSLVALAAAVPLAVYGAGLVARRLRRVSETAGRISAGDLDARTGPTKGRDEVAEIAATVDRMADSLSQLLCTERQFTADVAHELRTPVGGLLAAADLLPAGETEDLLRARVWDLRGLVEDLLEISRLDAGAEQPVRARVPLGAVVSEAVARTGLRTEVTVAETEAAQTVETDPRRLERIVSNLVVNAHRHGGPPVAVTVEGRTVVVRDHGPGFPADLLLHGPRRFQTGATERGTGHGLGLTIVLGQARLLDAELHLENAPDGGAVATLRLPFRPSGPCGTAVSA
ncbi:Signal transduction histidine kinase [Streptomyces sp. SceaMP-e96]|uniref:sensor histidine kinase n=1 Tax=Streptomyces sp. SceaMP-e96 TaxID=1100824 RepID=UPI000823EA60|nr:HAMP domain-containing sensor histidine kinase [Streptomyces sp. SceaMP-e96]MYT11661.1 HAMP domain-containing protein [Streptomyces sp. SID4951]SCK11392.1 Signal transduction histidine kinase [Streptomyces sp. SceaMP-e96]